MAYNQSNFSSAQTTTQGYGQPQQSNLRPLSIRSTRPGSIGPNWYLTDDFDGAHLVTDTYSNEALHIDSIFFEPSNNPQRPKSVARVTITMAGGLVRTGGWINQTEDGFLRFSPYQSEYQDNNGETKYSSPVNLSKLVAAQILRYANRLIVPFDPSMVARNNQAPAQGFDQQPQNNQAQRQHQGGGFQGNANNGQAQAFANSNNNYGNQFGNSTMDISDDDLPF